MALHPFGGRGLVAGVTPFGQPNATLAAAVERAGGLGVLDLGRDRNLALAALSDTARWVPASFGVRVGPGCPLNPADLPAEVDTVVLGFGSPWTAAAVDDRTVLVEVCSADEARAALAAGADGLIARGAESGGRVGELTTFVLLQTLLAQLPADVPVWAAGGIGLHTAAAAVAGGACGVVLDAQLSLVREAGLPRETAAAISAMDGSETVVVDGHRVFTRPDLAGRQHRRPATWPSASAPTSAPSSCRWARTGPSPGPWPTASSPPAASSRPSPSRSGPTSPAPPPPAAACATGSSRAR